MWAGEVMEGCLDVNPASLPSTVRTLAPSLALLTGCTLFACEPKAEERDEVGFNALEALAVEEGSSTLTLPLPDLTILDRWLAGAFAIFFGLYAFGGEASRTIDSTDGVSDNNSIGLVALPECAEPREGPATARGGFEGDGSWRAVLRKE